MKKFVIGILIGAVLAGAGGWYFLIRDRPVDEEAQEETSDIWDTTRDKINSEEVRRRIDEAGEVLRDQIGEIGDSINESTADVRITGAVKTQLALSNPAWAWEISVTTDEGRVTLEGEVDSGAQIDREISITKKIEGVSSVYTKLTVKVE